MPGLFLKNCFEDEVAYLSPVDSGKKIAKHQLSYCETTPVLPIQRYWQRNNCLRGLS